ncbi:hypothetical protein QYS47_34400 [Marivirga arenosa]|uniref:Tetratricopeptide repeat protein n=1 Tax=Marivirga arenosa TaxID=3059076 RepID=A0AA51ZVN2_9BACT|nr:hypothetical protein QYS47_34400 [Marivirga sp. BKB1-2]
MKVKFKTIILSLILLCISSSLSAQVSLSKVDSVLKSLYRFDFEGANHQIEAIDSIANPSLFNFLKSHYYRWYMMPIHEQSDQIIERYQDYLSGVEDIKHEDLLKDLNYSEINSTLLKAEYHYNKGNYYRAFKYGNDIYEIVSDHLEQEPELSEIKFLSGLYHFYYHYYKEQKPAFFAFSWIFKEGDKDTGLKWLEEVAQEESFVQTEANIYLAHIYLRIEDEPEKARQYVEWLNAQYPNNLKFYELYIETHLALDDFSPELKLMINKLLSSDKVYFQKYGKAYEAVLYAKIEAEETDKIKAIERAKMFISSFGKANHLMSLLLFQQYLMTGEEDWKDYRVYEYKLTSID